MLVPTNLIMAKHNAKIRKLIMPLSDARVKLCCETLAGMRVIKFFSWEERFGKLIEKLREKEVIQSTRELKLFATNIFIMICFPMFGMTATFTAAALSGVPISADTACLRFTRFLQPDEIPSDTTWNRHYWFNTGLCRYEGTCTFHYNIPRSFQLYIIMISSSAIFLSFE